ncbi:MAG: aldo/keto reductase [Bryobacterales bacterium]|nr:aldo/keto reductase [Bryobacterales bacterium]
MQRRTFLHVSAATMAVSPALLAAGDMAINTLGKSGLKVSQFTLGGYHMRVGGVQSGIDIIHRAIDLGVTHFDSARQYHGGDSDATYGKALQGGLRQKVLLMSKSNKRDAATAMKELEDTLRDMKTDHLDLWACHEVSSMDEVDKIFASGGAAEAFRNAKEQGKVRHIGFTGHRDPDVHLRMMRETEQWETVQMPINLVDPHYLSFLTNVLPEARKRGLGVLAMKSNAMGSIGKKGIAKIEECLRFTLSQSPDTLVSGVETLAQLEENVAIVKNFQAMSKDEQQTLLSRTAKGETGAGVERYKKPAEGAFRVSEHRDGEAA